MDRVRKRASDNPFSSSKKSRYEGGPTTIILPVFEPSGLLELESHNKEGVQLKHVDPPDAQCPRDYWNELNVPVRRRRLFQLMVYQKGQEKAIGEYNLDDKSNYIVGRALGKSLNAKDTDKELKEVVVADIRVPEETCSKQHCVIQFRRKEASLKVYVMDLDSSNGTSLNGVVLPRARYVELRSGDVIVLSAEGDSEYEIIFVSL